MAVRCINLHQNVSHSKVVVARGKHKGLCCACVGRLGSGNTTKGIRKSRSALKGIGQTRGHDGKRISAASVGFDAHRQKLLQLLARGADVSTVDKYVDNLVRGTLQRRALYVQKVTLVEAPCGEDSAIAQASADLVGASLRIIKPTIDQEF